MFSLLKNNDKFKIKVINSKYNLFLHSLGCLFSHPKEPSRALVGHVPHKPARLRGRLHNQLTFCLRVLSGLIL